MLRNVLQTLLGRCESVVWTGQSEPPLPANILSISPHSAPAAPGAKTLKAQKVDQRVPALQWLRDLSGTTGHLGKATPKNINRRVCLRGLWQSGLGLTRGGRCRGAEGGSGEGDHKGSCEDLHVT